MTYADRLVTRWQASDDDAERDLVFARLVSHCMRLPVVRAARRRTFTSVASHSPRFADDEEQAIRRAIWRAAKKFDPGRGVEFDAYVSRGIKVAVHDFWRQEAWIQDLGVHVPVAEWLRYRRAMSARAPEETGKPADCPLDLYLACTPAWEDEGAVQREVAVYDDYDAIDDEEVL